MKHAARVELLHPGTTDRFEYWQNRAGTVRLFRRHDGDWTATLDGRLVTERDDLDDNIQVVTATPLRSETAEGLALLLAMQDNVHALLDDAHAWGRGDEALLLRPRDAMPDEIAE